MLARGLSQSRTALNRGIVAFVSRPERRFSHPSEAVNTTETPVEGLRSGTAGKDANTVPIKDTIMRELASGELVISIQWSVVKGHLKFPLGLCTSVYGKQVCDFFVCVCVR